MYNRYINSVGEQFFTPMDDETDERDPIHTEEQNCQGGLFDGIKNIFSSSGLTFDLDTVFLLILIYFLLADGEDNMMETLLIVAALLFLGF